MQKKLLILVLTCLFCQILFAQQKKTGAIQFTDTLPNNKIDDFSNRNEAGRLFLNKDYSKSLETTVVVINNKIYRIDAKEFKNLQSKNILEMQVIKDGATQSAIKNIIIIKTK